ncbi:MAG TPA: 50S ribosomal protein L11 methyltransferase, partial [Candidatus Polarisedimenticolia bacterium]|nr:50S ribosomal protein L11 methyltransferase [Candidatus Polarisedimenticolia bacterium]
EREDSVVAAFWEAGCLGVQVLSTARSRHDPRLTLCAYFPGRSGRRRLESRLARAFGAAPEGEIDLGRARHPRLVPVRERRWVEIWQRSLRPMAIGRRFLVVPEGCRAPAARGRIVLRVLFGQAFGTGEHASTRMSLRLLERALHAGDRVADLGTGSGILAMAAAGLGAGRVLAIDDDPGAIEVARANLAVNHLAKRVVLKRADASRACDAGPFDLALVNIGAGVIARLMPDLKRALARGGRAVLAGILEQDEPDLLDRARASGLRLAGRLRARPWSALLLVR